MRFPSLRERLRLSLVEDDAFHDVTTRLMPGFQREWLTATLIAKDTGIFCGADVVRDVMKLVSPRVRVSLKRKDGQSVRPGLAVAKIGGPAWAILAGERLMLNLVCRASGIATFTRRYVEAVKGTAAKILD